MSANGGTDARAAPTAAATSTSTLSRRSCSTTSPCARPRRPKSRKVRSAPRSTCAPAVRSTTTASPSPAAAARLQRPERGQRSARRFPRQQYFCRWQVRRAAVGRVHRAQPARRRLEHGALAERGNARATAELSALASTRVADTGTATLAQINTAFRPRIPRYDQYEHEQERLGVTGSLQFAPSDATTFNLDVLYAKFDAERERNLPRGAGVQHRGQRA